MMVLKKILTEPNNCPRCDTTFHCGKSGKCWCYEVDVPVLIQEAISDKYSSCLCPDCLKALATNPKEKV